MVGFCLSVNIIVVSIFVSCFGYNYSCCCCCWCRLSPGASLTNQSRDYYNSVVPGGVASADESPQSRTSRGAANNTEESPDLID